MVEDIEERSYWQATAHFPTIDPSRGFPDRVDVAIVGGGYTGLNAALTLAKRGARVAVFEEHSFGWGASSRNGGQVLTGTKLSAGALVKRYGVDVARRMWRASMDAIDHIEALVHDEGIDCGFARSGHIELAAKPAHADGFAADAALLRDTFAHPVDVLTRAQLVDEIGSERYFGGLRDAASAGLHPGRYAAGLASAAQRAGALLFERTRVTAVTPRKAAQVARVETTRGVVKTDHVFIATNGYTGPLVPTLYRRVIPIGSYIVATERLPDALAREISPRGRMFYDTKNFLYYWRLSDDNRLIFGGRAEFVPPSAGSTRRSALALRNGILEVYPQLKDTAIDYAWGGTLAFTFDLLPHAGTTDDGTHYALGCGGHGVALLSHLGHCCARRMLGDPVDNPAFDLPLPGAPLGLYNGTPWFLPFAGAYYKLKDALQ
jgi:glycine/D-amino acid oxidase-like deaminating enzyme